MNRIKKEKETTKKAGIKVSGKKIILLIPKPILKMKSLVGEERTKLILILITLHHVKKERIKNLKIIRKTKANLNAEEMTPQMILKLILILKYHPKPKIREQEKAVKIIKLNTVEGRMKIMMMVRVGLRTKVRKGVVLIRQMLKILGLKMMQSLK